jgi:peroxiredoxin
MQQHDILDARGRWLLIDFMKTDCPHCRDLSKKLESVKARLLARVEVFSIVIPPDTFQTVNAYAAANRITGPILFDQGQVALAYFKGTGAQLNFDTPHLFAIDPNGMIVKDWSQAGVEAPGFQAELEQLLNKK